MMNDTAIRVSPGKSNYIALRLLLLLNLLNIPSSHAQQLNNSGGGAYPVERTECISPAEYAAARAEVDANVTMLRQKGVLPTVSPEMIVSFSWPLKLKNGLTDPSYYGIWNFVDQNTGAGLLDYNCGDRTYDGHKGTDIFTWPFPWDKMANNDVEVIAAAAGTIVAKYDGNFDQQCAWVNGAQGNAIILQHADGSRSWYWHFKKFSLTAKNVGASVAAGEYLGVVGSSGISTGPHLHFEVYDAGNQLIDPWAGTCNSLNSQSWWAAQKPYYDPKVNKLMTHSAEPMWPQCPPDVQNASNQFQPGNNIYFAAYYRDQLAGQVSNYSVIQPNGVVWASWTHTSQFYYDGSFWVWNYTLPSNAMNGIWTFRVVFNGETTSHNFQVGTCTLYPDATITNVSCNGGANGSIALTLSGGTAPFTYAWSNGQSSATATNLTAGTYTATVTDAAGCTGVKVSTVTQPAVLAVTRTITNVSCAGGSNGSVALSVTGGTTPYTYAWSNAQTGATATNLAAGTYTATVTDGKGCTATSSATVTQPAALSVTRTITNVSCAGGSNGSVALSVTGGTTPYTYAWSNAQTGVTATNLPAGTYTATVTDNKGCTATTTAAVTQPAALVVTKTISNVSCPNGVNGAVALSVAGGTTPYAYAWNNGQTAATATNLVAGTYTATVTDNKGCTATTTATVTQPAPFSIVRTTTHVSCAGGSDGSVALSVTGATPPYGYLWSSGQTTATIGGLVAGVYTATVTDSRGCVGTSSATVTQPAALSITKTVTNVSVPGGSDGSVALSVSGGTAPYTYLWSNSQTTATATGLTAGTYTVTVTDNKGCTATTSASVTQPTGAPTLVALTAATIRIKYFNPIAPATATAANLKIWGDETGLRSGTYTVSADTVTFVAASPFRPGELIHITSRNTIQFTGGGASTPFSWVRQAVVTNPTTAVFDTAGTGITLPAAAYGASASYQATMADLNRDGLQDLVFRYHASYGAATNVLVYLRNGNGTFAAPATYTNAESHSGLVGTPDLNNDGYADLVLTHNVPSAIHVRLNNGAGAFGAATLYPVSNYCNGAKVYDMDNDGDLDIVAFAGISTLASNTISLLKNNGNGAFAAQVTTNTAVFGTSCQPADLDRDGDMDLAYTSAAAFGSSKVFRVYRNDGTGALVLNNSETNNLEKQVLTAFDYNGDGNVDLITRNPNGEIYLGNSGINYSLAAPAAFTANYPWALSGDLDGDGDLDIFAPNSYNGTNWNSLPLALYRNHGSGTFATTTTALVLPLLGTADLSDYDGDGDLDHIYLNPANGAIKVALNRLPANCAGLAATAAGTPAYCGLANGAASLNVSGGTAPYSYAWSNGQTTVSIAGLVTGIYTATVTDGAACTVIASATVAASTAFPIQKTITNVSCPGGANGAATLSPSGGTAPYGYLWNNGLTSATASGLTAGVYTATVTDATGCSTTTTAMITQPATTPPPADACPNTCIHCDLDGYMGSTAGYTGNWVPGFCGTLESEQWLGFVATAPAVTITATPSNCALGHGVQLALYPDCTSNPISCNIGVSGGGNTPVSITANVTPGASYYLLVDGYAGDACNFTIDVTPPPVAVVRASVKAFLQGPYNSSTQLMHDSLRVKSLIPSAEPYSGLTNFAHVGGGGEGTTAAVLAVTGPNAIVDWVFLELRSAANPALVLATRSALLQRDGDVVDVDGVSPVAFGIAAGPSYFLAVRHRNHLGAQPAAAQPYPDCVALETDFRNLLPANTYAYNGLNPGQKVLTGKYTLWAGNGRIDTQLKYNGSNNDRNAVLNVVGLTTPNAVVAGYKVEDYNLDGVVKYNGSSNDRNVLLGNVGITTPSAIVHDQVAR